MFNEKKVVYKIVYNVWSQLYLSMFKKMCMCLENIHWNVNLVVGLLVI